MERIDQEQSQAKASPPVIDRRQKEGAPAITPLRYVRPELRREGDLRDITLGPTPGTGESAGSTIFKQGLGGGVPEGGSSSGGEGFEDQPEEKSEKESGSSGGGAGFSVP